MTVPSFRAPPAARPVLSLLLGLALVAPLAAEPAALTPGEGEGGDWPWETPLTPDFGYQEYASISQSRVKADYTCARVVALGQGAAGRRGPVSAGDDFRHWELTLAGSHAELEDKLAGTGGHHWDTGVTLAATWRESWHLAMQVGYGSYTFAGGGLTIDDTFVDLVALHQTLPWLAIGPFVEFAEVNLQTNFGVDDTSHVVAGGLLASASWQVAGCDLGVTSALASMNKRNMGQLFDNRDTAFATQVDLVMPLSSILSLTPYAYYLTMLDNEGPADGHYWLVGAELGWRPWEEVTVSVGFSTYLANDAYGEDRWLASLSYRF